MARPIHTERFDERREAIDAALHRYANTKAIHSGKELASRVLNFSDPESPYWPHRRITLEMARLRAADITEIDLLRRVVAYAAYTELFPPRSKKSEIYQLARAVLSLSPAANGARPVHRVLRDLGELITENLGTFAIHFLNRMKADADEERELKRACADFTEHNDKEQTQ